LERQHEALVTSLSKINEEIHLLEKEKLSLLEENPLASAEAAALMLGVHPTQGGYDLPNRT